MREVFDLGKISPEDRMKFKYIEIMCGNAG